MGSAEEEEEDEFHHTTIPPPPRKLADHPCVVPRKLRSAMIKRNHQVSISPTLPEAKKRVKGIKLKKEVPKKRSRKQSTAMATPITKDEEEVVETLNALAGIFSSSSSPPHSIAIDTTPIQFQCSPNNTIINTTTITQEETISQTDEHKGVLLQPLATTNDDNKKTLLLKRCATHVYVSHFIKVLQFVTEEEEEGKKGEEPSRTFTSQVSQKPVLLQTHFVLC
ncbi:uncharacterized protein LOC124932486 [Impatiens glandulifera]|uniref:uncharacterized protein LOC124932486 n=1 Tax=Impatiens glandulifera TaxID=253017 RepID=UPI001FB1683A|nr:uncharacterized protein LOC124932486 [Impatiens glandulifera]